MQYRSAGIVLLFVLTASPDLRGETVDVPSSKDNTIFSEYSNGSNGAGSYFFAGKTMGRTVRRALIAFDLTEYVPPGARIVSTSLRLYMSRTTSSTEPVLLHRLTSDWGEGDSNAPTEEGSGALATRDCATWAHTHYETQYWTVEGGDYQAQASAAGTVTGNGFYTWSSSQLATDVQIMVDDPDANFGWILIGNEGANRTTKRFNSRQHPTTVRRPVLHVEYEMDKGGGRTVDASTATGYAVLALLVLVSGSVGARCRRCLGG